MKKITALFAATLLVASASAQKLDRSIKPKPGPAPEINLGEIESFELENGLKVFVVENHKVPRVAYSIVLDVDPFAEGEAKGYTDVAGELMGRGTTSRAKDKLDAEVDFIGATLSTSSSGVYAASLTKHQDKLLGIMSDVVLNPAFKQEEFDKIITQTKSGLQTSKDDPDAIASNVVSALNFGKDHPYGEITTEGTVDNITLDMCKKYYQTYFKPNVAYMAVVGDVTVKEVKPMIEKYFGSWAKGDVPKADYPLPKGPGKTRVAVVNKPGAVQSVINVTYPVDLKPGADDAIKAQVLNTILGGGFTSRLFMNLREKHGFTYGSYSSLKKDEIMGQFSAYAKVRNEVTDSSVTEIMRELNRIRDEKVAQEELDGIKSYLTGNFAMSLESPQTIAKFAVNIERYGLPKDYYQNYLKNLSAVSVDDVQAMAKKYIRPDEAFITAVGNKDEIADNLAKFSANNEVEFYDIYGDVYKESMRPAPEGVTAKSVIDKYVFAVYGSSGSDLEKKLKKIKDVKHTMSASMAGMPEGMSITIERYTKAPNKMATYVKMGENILQKELFNGTEGRSISQQGTQKLEGKDLEEAKYEAMMALESKYDDLGFKLELKGMEKVEGNDAYVIEVTSPTGKVTSEYYDATSGYKVKSVGTEESPMGSMTVTSLMSDYKTVEGINYPHKLLVEQGPQKIDMTVTSIEVNTKLKDDLFE